MIMSTRAEPVEIQCQSHSMAAKTECSNTALLTLAYPDESTMQVERPKITETNGFDKPMVFRAEDFR